MEVPPELWLSSNCEMLVLRGTISGLELSGGCDPKTFGSQQSKMLPTS